MNFWPTFEFSTSRYLKYALLHNHTKSCKAVLRKIVCSDIYIGTPHNSPVKNKARLLLFQKKNAQVLPIWVVTVLLNFLWEIGRCSNVNVTTHDFT